MRVLSWNVQGAVPPDTPDERIEDQVSYLEKTADRPDVIALNKVNRRKRDKWFEELEAAGYDDVVHTLHWADELGEISVPPHQQFNHLTGNITATHEDSDVETLDRVHPSINRGEWKGSDLKAWDTNFPEKVLHAELGVGDMTIHFWNIRTVPDSMYGEEKIKILENTYTRIMKGEQTPCILAGDLNTPAAETDDGTIIPFRADEEGELAERWQEAERNILEGLRDNGMIDIFRKEHGYGDLDMLDVSHASQTEDPTSVAPESVQGERFDHIIASVELNPVDGYYDQDGFRYSDHAPIIGTFDI